MRLAGTMMAAMMIAAPVAAASVKDGVDAWQRGNYASAVAIWRPLAEGGDADAAFNLAQAYKLGRGVTADIGQAKTWYGKAAQGGHTQAAANYGLLLFQDGDRRSAMPWIQKASEAGDPRAQYVYATALFNGDLAARDWPKAYALMTRAAAAGLPPATTSLSQMDQAMTPADREKGLEMASQMAAQPMPAMGRQILTGGAPSALPLAPPIPSPPPPQPPARQVAQAAKPPSIDGPVRQPVEPPAPPKPKPVHMPPAPKPPAAKPMAAPGGKWLVQLGAYGSQAGAASAWGKVAGRLGGLRPIYEKAGAVVRLRAGPLADKAAAARACAAAGSACFPVNP